MNAAGDPTTAHSADGPWYHEWNEPIDPVLAFRKLVSQPHCLFLDSALRDSPQGRYSFLACDPFRVLELPVGAPDPLGMLERELARWTTETVPGLPPFQGGAAGVWGYELGHSLEQLPHAEHDEFQFPAMAVGLYDTVLAWDHDEDRCWSISHGFPQETRARRESRARRRLAELRERLAGPATRTPHHPGSVIDGRQPAPRFPVDRFPGLSSNVSQARYLELVKRAKEYIAAGDIFQVNVAQRLLHAATESSDALYVRLRDCNAAPFAGYFDTGTFQVVSASPERFVKVRDGEVEARPIKGTRPRALRPEADLFAAHELQLSEKDQAENVMIVDLLRNDLSRVCREESVWVEKLCGIESYAFVQHLVSVVKGSLRDDASPVDLIRAAFPGGSITGAPKIRAMEIIAELEGVARGAYCGSLGYISFDGAADLSILIRTITAGKGWWQLPVGGGIVAQSDPAAEYEETWHKAAGMLRALPAAASPVPPT